MSRLIYTSRLDGLMPQDTSFLLFPTPHAFCHLQSQLLSRKQLWLRVKDMLGELTGRSQGADCPRPRPQVQRSRLLKSRRNARDLQQSKTVSKIIKRPQQRREGWGEGVRSFKIESIIN